MNDFMIENGMVLPHTYDEPDCADDVQVCECCDGIRSDDEMSEIEGMCTKCYLDGIKSIQKLVEASGDALALQVFNYITED